MSMKALREGIEGTKNRESTGEEPQHSRPGGVCRGSCSWSLESLVTWLQVEEQKRIENQLLSHQGTGLAADREKEGQPCKWYLSLHTGVTRRALQIPTLASCLYRTITPGCLGRRPGHRCCSSGMWEEEGLDPYRPVPGEDEVEGGFLEPVNMKDSSWMLPEGLEQEEKACTSRGHGMRTGADRSGRVRSVPELPCLTKGVQKPVQAQEHQSQAKILF